MQIPYASVGTGKSWNILANSAMSNRSLTIMPLPLTSPLRDVIQPSIHVRTPASLSFWLRIRSSILVTQWISFYAILTKFGHMVIAFVTIHGTLTAHSVSVPANLPFIPFFTTGSSIHFESALPTRWELDTLPAIELTAPHWNPSDFSMPNAHHRPTSHLI